MRGLNAKDFFCNMEIHCSGRSDGMMRSVDLLVWGPRADRNVTSEIPAGGRGSCRSVTLGFPSNHLCWPARCLWDEVFGWVREPIGSSVFVCFEASSSVCQMCSAKGGLCMQAAS
jgi:hypothetical protein